MEEEKAAAYYEELLRKGSNAARFKQGLGFGGKHSEVSIPKSDAHASLSNFVKQASPGRAAAIQTETRVDSIRDKLKKKERIPSAAADDDDKRKHRQESRKDAEHVSGRGGGGGGSSPPFRDREDRSNSANPSGHRSPNPSRHRSQRRKHDSPSPKRSTSHSRDSRRSSSDCSPSRLKEKSRWWGHGDERDRSRSQLRERRQRDRKDHSKHWSKERSPRKLRRSHSFSSDSDQRSSRHSPRRGHIRSSDRSRKRSRTPSHSRKPQDRSHSTERQWGRARRSSSRDRDRRRRRSISVERIRKGRSLSRSQEREKGDGDGRSNRPGRSSAATRVDTSSRSHGRNGDSKTKSEPKVKRTAPDHDYSKLIPNFDSMTPAEKVKAKMKLQLSETVVKDTAKGMTGEWERFDFDKDAPLDDEAKLDYFGDGTGAIDDMGHMRNTGSTLLSTANQARREAQIQAAHDAAIFGALVADKDTNGSKTRKGVSGHRQRDSEEDLAAAGKRSDVTSLADEERSQVTEAPPGTGVVSEQIIAMQLAGSWQERAKKMREARAAAAAAGGGGLHMEISSS